MDCIWVNLKNVAPPLLCQFISKYHLHSEKIILSCYVALILQMKDSCNANLTFRAHNRSFSKMAAEHLNKSKLKTNTSTKKNILNLVTLPSFSISGEISAEKM